MGYSVKDISNAAEAALNARERNAERQGQELADSLISSTRNGRGLWIFILWPAWLLIMAFSGTFARLFLEKSIGISSPESLFGYLLGGLIAIWWYKTNFTRRHPFVSSVVSYFGTAFAFIYLTNAMGW